MRYSPQDPKKGCIPKFREDIWLELQDTMVTMTPCYQPEADGYIVSSLTIGMNDRGVILCKIVQ